MANTPKLLSGRVPVTPYSQLSNSRHEFLGLSEAEPNLGTGANGSVLTISTNNQRVFSNTITVANSTATITNLNVTGISDLGSNSNVKIAGGSAGYVLSTDGDGNLSWQSSVVTAAGANTQIQFNNNGSLGASSALTFDDTTNTVQIDGNLIANAMQLGSGIYNWSTTFVHFAVTVNTSQQVLYSVPAANISGADFHIISTNETETIRQTTKISTVKYDSQIQNNEYASLYVNGEIGSFTVEYNTGNIEVKVIPNYNSQTTYKMLITLFSE